MSSVVLAVSAKRAGNGTTLGEPHTYVVGICNGAYNHVWTEKTASRNKRALYEGISGRRCHKTAKLGLAALRLLLRVESCHSRAPTKNFRSYSACEGKPEDEIWKPRCGLMLCRRSLSRCVEPVSILVVSSSDTLHATRNGTMRMNKMRGMGTRDMQIGPTRSYRCHEPTREFQSAVFLQQELQDSSSLFADERTCASLRITQILKPFAFK